MTETIVPSVASCMITKVQLTTSTSPKWRNTISPIANLHHHPVASFLQAPSARLQLHQLPTTSVHPKQSSIRTELLQVQSARGRVAGDLRMTEWSCRFLLSSFLIWLSQILMHPRCLVRYHVCVSFNKYLYRWTDTRHVIEYTYGPVWLFRALLLHS